jgi:hypothetical protein
LGGVLALALLAARTGAIPDVVEQNPVLELDSCLGVDESVVRKLLELELRNERIRDAALPISVGVRCIEDAQEIRVEPWASLGEEGIRPIQLPAPDDADPAAHEARSRELALAIAELIRRLEIRHPLPSEPPPPPPVPVAPAVVVSRPPPPEQPEGRWQLGILSAFDTFSGGQRLAGGDVSIASSVGRFTLIELRAGGRVAAGATLASGQLSARAGTASAAAGLNVWSRHRSVGLAFMLRAQGYLMQFHADSPPGGASGTAVLGALTVAAEPRLMVAVSRRVSLTAAADGGLPVHGIVVRTQGVEAASMSGLFLSGNLGVVLTF